MAPGYNPVPFRFYEREFQASGKRINLFCCFRMTGITVASGPPAAPAEGWLQSCSLWVGAGSQMGLVGSS